MIGSFSTSRPDLSGKETCSDKHIYVRTDEPVPGGGLLTLGGRRELMPLNDVADCLVTDCISLYWREHGMIPAIQGTPRGHWWHTVTLEALSALDAYIRRAPIRADDNWILNAD
jgi:hypothetical protein